MAKLVRLSDEIVAFKCAGCRGPHQLSVTGSKAWGWNGSMDKPTFTPSILSTWVGSKKHVCHSYVTDGKIQFLSDCTHALAGQTVELPEVEVEADLFKSGEEG